MNVELPVETVLFSAVCRRYPYLDPAALWDRLEPAFQAGRLHYLPLSGRPRQWSLAGMRTVYPDARLLRTPELEVWLERTVRDLERDLEKQFHGPVEHLTPRAFAGLSAQCRAVRRAQALRADASSGVTGTVADTLEAGVGRRKESAQGSPLGSAQDSPSGEPPSSETPRLEPPTLEEELDAALHPGPALELPHAGLHNPSLEASP